MGCSDRHGRRPAAAGRHLPPDRGGALPGAAVPWPYAKGASFQTGYAATWNRLAAEYPEVTRNTTNKYQNFEVVDPERWVSHGYGVIRVDSRGAGRSPGYLNPFSAREIQDLHDCIEWAGTLPWCNGKVGLAGVSLYAQNQWQVAATLSSHHHQPDRLLKHAGR